MQNKIKDIWTNYGVYIVIAIFVIYTLIDKNMISFGCSCENNHTISTMKDTSINIPKPAPIPSKVVVPQKTSTPANDHALFIEQKIVDFLKNNKNTPNNINQDNINRVVKDAIKSLKLPKVDLNNEKEKLLKTTKPIVNKVEKIQEEIESVDLNNPYSIPEPNSKFPELNQIYKKIGDSLTRGNDESKSDKIKVEKYVPTIASSPETNSLPSTTKDTSPKPHSTVEVLKSVGVDLNITRLWDVYNKQEE